MSSIARVTTVYPPSTHRTEPAELPAPVTADTYAVRITPRQMRQIAAGTVAVTSGIGLVAGVLATVSSLGPTSSHDGTRSASQIVFGVVLGGIALSAVTQKVAAKRPPSTPAQHRYTNFMLAASGIGLMGLVTGVTASFLRDGSGAAAGLFGTSMGCTILTAGLAGYACHVADYT